MMSLAELGERLVIGGTLVTSCVMRKILTRNDACELRRW